MNSHEQNSLKREKYRPLLFRTKNVIDLSDEFG